MSAKDIAVLFVQTLAVFFVGYLLFIGFCLFVVSAQW